MKRQLAFVLGGFLVAALADAWLLGAEHHGEHWWSDLYGFYSVFGFAGALAIIAVAKLVLAPFLQRQERYYRERSSP